MRSVKRILSVKNVSKEKREDKYGWRRCVRTPFNFPSFNSLEGLSFIKSPSTTGVKAKVPKNSLLRITWFAACNLDTSVWRRHVRVSMADVQL